MFCVFISALVVRYLTRRFIGEYAHQGNILEREEIFCLISYSARSFISKLRTGDKGQLMVWTKKFALCANVVGIRKMPSGVLFSRLSCLHICIVLIGNICCYELFVGVFFSEWFCMRHIVIDGKPAKLHMLDTSGEVRSEHRVQGK